MRYWLIAFDVCGLPALGQFRANVYAIFAQRSSALGNKYTDLQRQKAVSAYFTSEQILFFEFTRQL